MDKTRKALEQAYNTLTTVKKGLEILIDADGDKVFIENCLNLYKLGFNQLIYDIEYLVPDIAPGAKKGKHKICKTWFDYPHTEACFDNGQIACSVSKWPHKLKIIEEVIEVDVEETEEEAPVITHEIRNEIDMLNGNIARMCVCSDKEELAEMLCYSISRLHKIYQSNVDRLNSLTDD